MMQGMKKVLAFSMKKYFQMRMYKIDFWRNTQLQSQEFLLLDLLKKGQDTRYGQQHSFTGIDDYSQFKSSVPIVQYEQISHDIQDMMAGEKNILWPGHVRMFSKSSGTTNDISKYIPVSKPALNRNMYKAGRDLYSLYLHQRPESKILEDNGAAFSLGGSFELTERGFKVGDVSAIIMSELPSWAQNQRQPSLEVALMTDWAKKIPAMINDTLDKNITHLSGVPTWFVPIFDELQKIRPYNTLRDIWPNLELFVHGAVSFQPYRQIFRDFLPHDDMNYMEVYNASEGFFAVQDSLDKPGELLLLTDHGIFYEFVPMDSYYDNPSQHAVPLSEVSLGVNYALIITTNAGLWRYDIGDTIMFTNLEPYRIKITGRTKQSINVFGEELMVGNADQAIAEISMQHNCTVEHYTAGPVFMNNDQSGAHQWLVEFKQKPTDIVAFAHDLDTCLQGLNSDYGAKRAGDIALGQLQMLSVPSGTFMRWMESKGKTGGQHKVPKLSATRKYIDEILDHIKNYPG